MIINRSFGYFTRPTHNERNTNPPFITLTFQSTKFAIIAFTTLMGFDLRTAGGNAKVLNLASNYASLVTYLSSGLVVFSIGIPCAISGIVGNLLGSHFALKNGAKFIRPMMLVVLVLLLGKIVSDAVL